AIVYVDYPFPKSAHTFTESGPYFLWLVFLCGQMALWLALLPTLVRAVAEFAASWPRYGRPVVAVAVVFFLLVALPVVVGQQIHSTPDYPLPGHTIKITVLTLIGVAVALIGAVAVALIYAAIGEALEASGHVSGREIETFFRLRGALVP